MEYYSAIKNNEFMKFLGKWMDMVGIILSEIIQYKITHMINALTDIWILAQKLRIPNIQFAKHIKFKKNEDQSVNTSPLLRIGNKTPMEGVTVTKFGAETKGWTIQGLPHLGVHPKISQQTQTLLHTPARFC